MTKTITAISPQKRNPERMNIYLDGDFGFGLQNKLAAGLGIGQELSAADIETLKRDDEIEKSYLKALNFISYRPRSEAEVARRMAKYETPEEMVDEVMARLKQNNFVDDIKFAEMWVENRCEFRPRGSYALRMELRQKGIKEEIADQALSNLDEEQLALKAAQKSLKRYENLPEKDFQRKLYGYLSRRGFGYDTIRTTIDKLRSEYAEEFESNEVMK